MGQRDGASALGSHTSREGGVTLQRRSSDYQPSTGATIGSGGRGAKLGVREKQEVGRLYAPMRLLPVDPSLPLPPGFAAGPSRKLAPEILPLANLCSLFLSFHLSELLSPLSHPSITHLLEASIISTF